jgi:hypothetical protein
LRQSFRFHYLLLDAFESAGLLLAGEDSAAAGFAEGPPSDFPAFSGDDFRA